MTLQAIADSIKLLASIAGVLVIAYAGVILMFSNNPHERSHWKEIILGVVIGLCIVFLAPVISSILSGGSYCA
ncbi:hypothetical protein HZC07_04575 [Candidatus Micrarchaeota archaeon]|nr:hypothetical protein [Candidatus Micrarchaeota archaeon]